MRMSTKESLLYSKEWEKSDYGYQLQNAIFTNLTMRMQQYAAYIWNTYALYILYKLLHYKLSIFINAYLYRIVPGRDNCHCQFVFSSTALLTKTMFSGLMSLGVVDLAVCMILSDDSCVL